MAKYILTDTGYWIGLLDSRDEFHEKSIIISELLEGNNIVIPWPCLYETINTRLTRRKTELAQFENILKDPRIIYIDDNSYKSLAIEKVFERNNNYSEGAHSLVDSVIREMLLDVNLKIDYLATFNERDFQDICIKRNIEILS
jgi:predicted nucleic acid-binding protein